MLVAPAALVALLAAQLSSAGFANPANSKNLANPANPEPPEPPENPQKPAWEPMAAGTHEWTIGVGTGWGVPIFGSVSDQSYWFPSISWGRVLTGPRGRGVYRGRFTWGVEVLPFLIQYRPIRAYGFGISPLLWRWSLEPRGRFAPFVEMGGGGLWTNTDLPGDTTRANYTAHVAAAVRVLHGGARGVLVGYRFDHISNGNRVRLNPGVNAHVMFVGWTTLRRGSRAPP